MLVIRLGNESSSLLDRELVTELSALVRGLREDASVGAVVLTGARPGCFLTHYDIAEMLTGAEQVGMAMPVAGAAVAGPAVETLARMPGGRRLLRRTRVGGVVDLNETRALFRDLERLDKVVIAAIGGPALGASCELALACDLRYISSGAGAIGSPELTQGFAPGAGGTQRHPRALGQAAALELMLECRMVTPDEALDAGLVHRVVPPERLLDEALATADRLSRRAPASIAAVKHAIYEGRGRSLDSGLAVERGWFMAALSRPATRRALQRYVDDLGRDGRGGWEDEATFAAWREGTAVELV